ncbi:MAG: zinc-ribbon domain-containing protein [Desulfobacterales bacterium]|nr:zinc-ribbon domain-containing protein [Desulfobacterales bacterium]
MKKNRMPFRLMAAAALMLSGTVFLGGCATTSTETASRDTLTEHVGEYPPPPPGMARVRVGVPAFKVNPAHVSGEQLENLAADELTTLAFRTRRFDIVERAQMEQLLKEQGLKGVVRQDELASKARVRGVDYLFLGKVTNFRVKEENTKVGAGLARLGSVFGAVDVEKSQKQIHVDCGVDLRLVNPEDGTLLAASFGEYKRTDSVSAMGFEILGTGVRSKSDLRISKENRGKILRLALDEAVRKMLPDIDRSLQSASGNRSGSGTANQEGAVFCPQCGAKLDSDARFCRECGAALK